MYFTLLLKKEFNELLHYKNFMLCLIVFVVPFLLVNRYDQTFISTFMIFLVCASSGQYMYLSFVTDIKDKGILLYHNLGISFTNYILSKIIITFFFTLILALIRLDSMLALFHLYDLIWIILIAISCSILMFIMASLFKGQEIGSSIIVILVSTIVIVFEYIIGNFFLRCCLAISLAFINFIICKKLFFSKYFKKLI